MLLESLLISLLTVQSHRLEFLVHVPAHAIGMSVVVACEAEDSPVMDEARELDGQPGSEEFRFTQVPSGSCEVDVTVVVQEKGKERTLAGRKAFVMGF